MPVTRQRLADRLLLVGNLVVATLAAAVYVVLFVQPGALVGVDPSMLLQSAVGLRLALLPLHTPLAWLVLLVCLALLLANLAWLLRRREPELPSHWVLSETPSGPVRVSREALETGLRQAGEALPEITRLRVQVDPRAARRIVVTVQFQCAEGANNLAASQRVRQVLQDRFGELVRLTDGAAAVFELEFQGFAGKLGKKAAELPPPEPAPFTGPKYPIDDDSPLGGNA